MSWVKSDRLHKQMHWRPPKRRGDWTLCRSAHIPQNFQWLRENDQMPWPEESLAGITRIELRRGQKPFWWLDG